MACCTLVRLVTALIEQAGMSRSLLLQHDVSAPLVGCSGGRLTARASACVAKWDAGRWARKKRFHGGHGSIARGWIGLTSRPKGCCFCVVFVRKGMVLSCSPSHLCKRQSDGTNQQRAETNKSERHLLFGLAIYLLLCPSNSDEKGVSTTRKEKELFFP